MWHRKWETVERREGFVGGQLRWWWLQRLLVAFTPQPADGQPQHSTGAFKELEPSCWSLLLLLAVGVGTCLVVGLFLHDILWLEAPQEAQCLTTWEEHTGTLPRALREGVVFVYHPTRSATRTGGRATLHELHRTLLVLGISSFFFRGERRYNVQPFCSASRFRPYTLTNRDIIVVPEVAKIDYDLAQSRHHGARLMKIILGNHSASRFPDKDFLPIPRTNHFLRASASPGWRVLFPPMERDILVAARNYRRLPKAARPPKEDLVIIDNDFPFDVPTLRRVQPNLADIRFVRLENMSHQQVISLYTRAKVVVDWHVPGAERIVHESVLFDVHVLVADVGNGHDDRDFPIPVIYKVQPGDYAELGRKIQRSLYRYEATLFHFDPIQNFVMNRQQEFVRDVGSVFASSKILFFTAAPTKEDFPFVWSFVFSALTQYPLALVEVLVQPPLSAFLEEFESVVQVLFSTGVLNSVIFREIPEDLLPFGPAAAHLAFPSSLSNTTVSVIAPVSSFYLGSDGVIEWVRILEQRCGQGSHEACFVRSLGTDGSPDPLLLVYNRLYFPALRSRLEGPESPLSRPHNEPLAIIEELFGSSSSPVLLPHRDQVVDASSFLKGRTHPFPNSHRCSYAGVVMHPLWIACKASLNMFEDPGLDNPTIRCPNHEIITHERIEIPRAEELDHFLSFEMCGDFLSQYGALLNGVALAALLDAQAVLPIPPPSEKGNSLKFSDLYDVDAFVTGLSPDVRIVKHAPAYFGHSEGDNWNIVNLHDASWWEGGRGLRHIRDELLLRRYLRVGCTHDAVTWDTDELRALRVALVRSLKPGTSVHPLVSVIRERLEAISSGRGFAALHLSIGESWYQSCHKQDGMVVDCYVGPRSVVKKVIDWDLSRDQPIFVVCDTEAASVREAFQDSGYQLFTKEDLVGSELSRESYEPIVWDAVEFFVCTMADVFIGNAYTSFFFNIAQSRMDRDARIYAYNAGGITSADVNNSS